MNFTTINVNDIASEIVNSNVIAQDVRNKLSRIALINRLTMIAASKVCGECFFNIDMMTDPIRAEFYGLPPATFRKIPKTLHTIGAKDASIIISTCKNIIKGLL